MTTDNIYIELEILRNQGEYLLKKGEEIDIHSYEKAIKKFGFYLQDKFEEERINIKAKELQNTSIGDRAEGQLSRVANWYLKHNGWVEKKDEKQYLKIVIRKLDALKYIFESNDSPNFNWS